MLTVIISRADEVAGFDSLLQEILTRGNSIRCKASGISMYPFIRNGDVLLIEPNGTADYNIGDVILFLHDNGTYVTHRLIRKDGSSTLITKGDNTRCYDSPVHMEQVLGRVIQIEHGGKRLKLTGWRIRSYNRLLSWFGRGRYPNQTRMIRNLSKMYWLIGGRLII